MISAKGTVKYMSPINNNESCVYCKAKLFSDDDVVYCPVCGAPHHRECYNTLGHCALHELHGTENEYSKEKELEKLNNAEEKQTEEVPHTETTDETNLPPVSEGNTRCKMCGEEYPYSKAGCPKCGAPNFVRINGVSFDFLGGIPKDEEIAPEITAEDAGKFVISNTHRYIPKFAQLKGKRKKSWNWMAFLFPSCWFFSRKMYKQGFLTGTLLLVSQLLYYPLLVELTNLGVYDGVSSYFDLLQNVSAVTPDISSAVIIITFLSVAITVFTRILSGIYGDYIYKKHTVSVIKKIRLTSTNSELDCRKKGGVNFFLFLLSYLLLNYLPQFLLELM